MDNTLIVNLSHQLAAYRSMDVIANNLANLSTPGFKRESVKFEELVSQIQQTEGDQGPRAVSFVQDKGVVRDLNEGRMERTNAPYDFAINGKGYFTIQTPSGNRYTRDGHFTLDPDGDLVTENGDKVIGDGGPITITPQDGDVQFAQDGSITGKQGQLGKLQMVSFADERAMQKDGGNLYSTTQTPVPATTAKLQQGMLEASNVEPVIEISHMIEIQRAYQAMATLGQSQEDLMRSAIDKLGSVGGNS